MKLILVGCVFVAASCGARVDGQSLRHQPREFLQRTPGSGILQVHHGVHFAPLSLTRRQDAAATFTGSRDGFSQEDRKQQQAVIHFSQPRHGFLLQRHQDFLSNIQGANRRQFSQPQHDMLTQRQQDLNRAQFSQFQQEFRPQFSQRQQERFTQSQKEMRPQFSQRQQQTSLRRSQEARPQFLQGQQDIDRFQVSQSQQEFRPQSSQRRQEMFSQRQEESVPQFSQRHQDMFSQQQQEVRSQFSGQRQEPKDQFSRQPQEILSQFQQERRDRFSQHQKKLRPQLQQVFSQRQHETRQLSERQQNMQLSQQQQERRPQFSQQEQESRSQLSQQEQKRRSQFSQQEQERSQFSQQEQERSQFSQQQQEQGQQQQERRSQFSQQQQERRPQFSQQRQEMSRQQTLTTSPNLVNIEGSSFQFQFGQSIGSRRDQTSQSLQQQTTISTRRQDTPHPAAFHSQQQGVAALRSDERQHIQQPTTQLRTRQPHSTTTKMQDKRKKTEIPANIQTTQMQVISGHIESNVGSIVLGVFRPFFVPRSATLAEGQVSSTFKCSQYGQGHFADRESDCRMFHVCTPVKATREAEATHHYRFTFRCGEGERFDDASASCLRSDSCPASSLTQRQSSSSSSLASARLFMDFPLQTPKPADVCYLATDFIITGVRRK